MTRRSREWPEAIPTTLEIAERCNVEIELGSMLIPSYPTPDGEAEGDYLRELAEEGLRRRYGDPSPAEARRAARDGARGHRQDGLRRLLPDRLGLRQVRQGQRHRGRARAVARRPARSSSYALNITDVDPLAYDLLFERFLNAERVSMPDIDIDFSVKGRDRVIALRAPTSTAASRSRRSSPSAACSRAPPRATPRACSGYDYGAGDRLAKMIPDPIMGRSPSFEDCLKEGASSDAPTTPTARGARDHRHRAAGSRASSATPSIHAAGGRDRRPAAHRHRAAAAGRGPRRGARTASAPTRSSRSTR